MEASASTRTPIRSIRLALALVLALGLVLGGGTGRADAAGGSCTGYVKRAHDIRWNAFVGHRVVLDFTECGYRRTGMVGPVVPGIRGMRRPVLALQNRIPFAGGETLRVSTPVYHYSSTRGTFKYRWVLVQGHVATPRLTQNWHMELQVRRLNSPIARICFVGRACSAWQN